MAPHTSGRTALRVGALFGFGWGILLIANYYLVQVHGVRFTTIASLVLALVVYLLAGALAAAQTGKISTGLLAGLWTGLFSSLVNAVGVIIILLSDPALVERIRQVTERAVQAAGASAPHVTAQLVMISSVVSLVLGAVIASAVGLGLGALGGLIGKSRTPRPPERSLYQEAMYQGPSSAPGQPPSASPPPPSGHDVP